MFDKFWTTYFVTFILFVFISKNEGLKSDSAKCFVKLNNFTYEINILEKHGSAQKQKQNRNIEEWSSNANEQKTLNSKTYHSRYKRSTTAGEPQVLDLEVSRLKRKIGRLEKKLSESMDDLSKEVTKGFRRMEEKIRDIGTPSHSKREVRYLSSQTPCPQDFQLIDVGKLQSCYLLSNFNTTWYEANEYCTALGSDLVALESIQEHYVLTYIVKNHQDHSKVEGWWTSGMFVSKTKQWMWATDITVNKPFTFIRWASNQPDDDSSNCVYLRRDDDQLWNDELCTSKFNFVCETCFGCHRHNGY
ncbi:unnamed protein product [Mytilus coruscus]|uniref:C-type lectin domain-containing protein n=1 Tax=Mytilus coruscus TaxID=42192 RepID=A0A6J8EHW5_MYTCO|nr:unnamed protein product [Mytilus coruscus]